MPKVLFLHANTEDYLAASLFHGLRTVLGANCVDLPRFDCMYRPLSDEMRQKIRGKGFTLYGLLPEMPELANARFFIWETDIRNYDFYIIADIWRQWYDYERLCRLVDRERIVVLDPADKPRVFPWNNLIKEHRYFRRSLRFLRLQPHFYFKREMVSDKEALAALPSVFRVLKRYLLPDQIRPISFSIPAEKILEHDRLERTQLFASNIVDPEVSKKVSGSVYTPLGKQQYAFETEQDYYVDIQRSRFGITVKRSGWDCLRHYEIAANGAIPCFKQLDQKPFGSAPFGLDSGNCISYSDYYDLVQKLESLDSDNYKILQRNSRTWINYYTTSAVANRFLEDLKRSRNPKTS